MHRGERGHRPDEHRCGVLVDRLSLEPGRGRTYRPPSLRWAWAQIRPAQRGFDDPRRCDAQAFHATARLAGARFHGARASDLAGAATAAAYAAVAVARLFARRLVAELGYLRPTRRRRRVGA